MKNFLALSLLFSFSALASCPDFAPLYTTCESSSHSIHAIAVKAKEPFYKFTFHDESGSYREYFITDGELRNVRIQTQDGQETSYTQSASCSDNQLQVERVLEGSSLTEETIFAPSEGKMDVHHYSKGILVNSTTCYISLHQEQE